MTLSDWVNTLTTQSAPVPRPRTDRSRRAEAKPPPSPQERAGTGKAARRRVPHDDHAGFELLTTRPDPVALLESQAVTRVPDLVPIRYGRMAVSPFTFYRGAALIMAHDLAGTPTSGHVTQLCGDAHLSNFGLFASPERRLLFDLNDFDETMTGPWEWDVKRLVASFSVAARSLAIPAKKRRAIVRDVTARYRLAMREFAKMRDLDVWYAHIDVADIRAQFANQVNRVELKKFTKTAEKARTKDSMQALAKLTRMVDGQRRIVSDPPLLVPIDEVLEGVERGQLEMALRDLIYSYRQTLQSDLRVLLNRFQVVDFARKVVGVGSVGTRCWILLMLGRDDNDPLFLQAKEAGPSVLGVAGGKSTYANEGHRVVAGQRLMQTVSDIFLGWQRVQGVDGQERDFYIRQLRDWKGSAEIETMDPVGLTRYGELCAWTLARAHARAGDRIGIAAYLGGKESFDWAMTEFAESYADQNERDYSALLDAIDSGRVTARPGL